MSEVVPLVSVLATATVALVVPVVSSRLDSNRAKIASSQARLDELRAVADAASVALANAETKLESASQRVEEGCRDDAGEVKTNAAIESLQRLDEAIDVVYSSLHRMAVRLGWAAPAVRAYSSCHQSISRLQQLWVEILAGGPSADDPDSWSEVADALRQPSSEYSQARVSFYEATGAMFGAV